MNHTITVDTQTPGITNISNIRDGDTIQIIYNIKSPSNSVEKTTHTWIEHPSVNSLNLPTWSRIDLGTTIDLVSHDEELLSKIQNHAETFDYSDNGE